MCGSRLAAHSGGFWAIKTSCDSSGKDERMNEMRMECLLERKKERKREGG